MIQKPRRFFVGTAAVLAVWVAATAHAQTIPVRKCQGAKNDVVGKYAACRQKAEKLLALKPGATAKYDDLVAKCESKFGDAWQKAEGKATAAGATCPEEPLGDSDFKSLIDTHSSAIGAGLASGRLPSCPGEPPRCTVPAGLGDGPAQHKCRAAKNLIAGVYAQCRQAAERTRATNPADTSKFDEMVAACATKFTQAWQKVDDKAAAKDTVCPDAPLTSADFQNLIDLHSDDMATALASARLREHCGDACVKFANPPPSYSGPAAEFCGVPCSVDSSVTPNCGTCAAVCDLGESCINGTCHCLEGAPTCRPTRPVPLCPVVGRGGVITYGCWFLEGVDAADVTLEHQIVEINGAANTDLWIHVDGRSLFPDGATIFPVVMECQEGKGQLWYPNNKIQATYFGDNGVITSVAGLDSVTTTTRACKAWEDGPVIPLFSTTDFPRGHLLKFRPGTDESGYAYQVVSVLFVDQPSANTTLHVVDYVINILPDPCAPITVTATAQGPLSVAPAGAATLAQGATPSYEVTVDAPVGGILVGGTCPRGAWSGGTYSITEPLEAGCSVDFRPAP